MRLSGSESIDASVVTYSLRAVAVPGHRLEPARARKVDGFAGVFCGFCGARSTGWRTGALSSRPCASKCSRYGPNSSPTQNVPSSIRAIDSTSKSAPVSQLAVPNGRVDRNLRPVE